MRLDADARWEDHPMRIDLAGPRLLLVYMSTSISSTAIEGWVLIGVLALFLLDIALGCRLRPLDTTFFLSLCVSKGGAINADGGIFMLDTNGIASVMDFRANTAVSDEHG